jgi:hypothetical protein
MTQRATYRKKFAAWREAAKQSRNFADRPEPLKNPYPLGTGKGRRSGAYQWDAGYRYGLAEADRKERLRK